MRSMDDVARTELVVAVADLLVNAAMDGAKQHGSACRSTVCCVFGTCIAA